jgi:otoferlin
VIFPRFKRNLMVELPVIVRVYVVKALNLRSRDIYGQSDAFIKLELGNQVISDRAHYIPNQSNPIFGKRFQLSTIIPRNTLLKVSVYDNDTLSGNDLIGTTVIDLEDRIRTKYLATCGLPNEYNFNGYNAWRNSQLPSEILNNICNEFELSLPQYFPDRVYLAGLEFKDSSKVSKDENFKERLALSVLNNFDRLPGIGYNFVPEHVETRSIYRDDRPGVEQGKLLMWVEIFDPKKSILEPVDITPMPARRYEVRVIIWNAKDVILDEKNIFGNQMSDIYVKGFVKTIELFKY